jgi:hypothetical protein
VLVVLVVVLVDVTKARRHTPATALDTAFLPLPENLR